MALIGTLLGVIFVFYIIKFIWGISKVCPYCREAISKFATKCPKCTSNLN